MSGTPADPAAVPAAHTTAKGTDHPLKPPYDRLVDARPPQGWTLSGDPAQPTAPFTRDEAKAMEAAFDAEEATKGDLTAESHTTTVAVQEVVNDAHRRLAGTAYGDALAALHKLAFRPSIERWQFSDPDAVERTAEVPTFVRCFTPPMELVHLLWAPSNHPDIVHPHAWRAMLGAGLVNHTGGRLNVGNERAGLAATLLYASVVREIATGRPRPLVRTETDSVSVLVPDDVPTHVQTLQEALYHHLLTQVTGDE